MSMEQLPRRMLSAWVPHARPVGAPRLTFGRSVAKAMDVFDLDSARWPELAADRLAWQTMLRDGAPPPTFRKPPPPAVPMPISHFLVRPRRRAAEKTNAAIDASVRPRAGGGVAARHRQEEAQQVENITFYSIFYLGPEIPAVP